MSGCFTTPGQDRSRSRSRSRSLQQAQPAVGAEEGAAQQAAVESKSKKQGARRKHQHQHQPACAPATKGANLLVVRVHGLLEDAGRHLRVANIARDEHAAAEHPLGARDGAGLAGLETARAEDGVELRDLSRVCSRVSDKNIRRPTRCTMFVSVHPFNMEGEG